VVFVCRVLTRAAVFTFDFSGSGQSGGDYVSLGVFEKGDVAAVVEFLRSQSDFVSTIGLWGRSSKYPVCP
jgi:alpha/beta superfamily hydrolase